MMKKVLIVLRSEAAEVIEFSMMAMTFVVAIVVAAGALGAAIDARLDVATAVFGSGG